MRLVVVAVGTRMPAWVDTAFDEYAQRMPADLPIVLQEVKAEPRGEGRTVDAMKAAEAVRIRGALPKRGVVVALDEHGRDTTSAALASSLQRWRADGDDVVFLVGGPDGLDGALRDEASAVLRLSSLTLPHGLARVVLAEQLYRAWSIVRNHPYHRA